MSMSKVKAPAGKRMGSKRGKDTLGKGDWAEGHLKGDTSISMKAKGCSGKMK